MSITSETVKQTYVSQGETQFEIPFPFIDPNDIKVLSLDETALTENQLVIEKDYTVGTDYSSNKCYFYLTESGLGKTPKGNRVTVIRRPPITQETVMTENDPFYVSTIENMADKLTYIAQMLKDDIERSIKYPTGLSYKPDYSEIEKTIDKAYEASKKAEEATKNIDEDIKKATNSADKAQQWAANPENVPVEDGKYSAYHYAMQAEKVNDFATTDEALAGTETKKAMAPFTTKSAAAYFASANYFKNEYKNWGSINLADKNGILLCMCTYGKQDTGAVFTLDVSEDPKMLNIINIITADCVFGSISQTFVIPISKGLYYRANGGLPDQVLLFIPSNGDL